MSKFKFGNFFRDFAKGFFSPASLISSLVKNFSGNSTSDVVGNYLNGVTGAGLTNAQIQNMDWQSQEAQAQRTWEEQMDNTKYQRQTVDMMAAGLNPAMMYGGTSVASAPSGASASGGDVGSPSVGLIDSVLSLIFAKQRLNNLKLEGEVLKTKADEQSANAGLARENTNLAGANVRYTNLLADWYPKLSQGTLDEISGRLKKIDSDIDVNASVVNRNDAEAELVRAKKVIEDINKEWLPKLNDAHTAYEKAAAVKAYADAAWQKYFKEFSEAHAGVTPGRDLWAGFAATMAESMSHVIGDIKNFITELIPNWIKFN